MIHQICTNQKQNKKNTRMNIQILCYSAYFWFKYFWSLFYFGSKICTLFEIFLFIDLSFQLYWFKRHLVNYIFLLICPFNCIDSSATLFIISLYGFVLSTVLIQAPPCLLFLFIDLSSQLFWFRCHLVYYILYHGGKILLAGSRNKPPTFSRITLSLRKFKLQTNTSIICGFQSKP